MFTRLKSGRALYGMALIAFGIIQFITASFVVGRAPTWTWAQPAVAAWAYLSGTVLIAAGAGILTNRKAKMAAILIGIMILLAPVMLGAEHAKAVFHQHPPPLWPVRRLTAAPTPMPTKNSMVR